MTILFQNQTGNGVSTIFPASGTYNGGPVFLAITGTFDTATVEIQIDQDGLGFITLQGVSQTLTDVNRIAMISGQRLRLNLTSAGGSTDITASVDPSS